MAEYRKHDPKLPTNTTNPTGTQPIIDKASRDIVARYRKIYAGVKERIVTLELSPEQTESLLADMDAVLTRWLLEGKEPKRLWYGAYTVDAATLGATQAAASLARLSADYTRTTEAIVYSDAFINRVAMAKIQDFAEFSEIKGAALNDISSIITQAVADGSSVKDTARIIGERLEVSASKAKLYAQTSLPNVLRETRWAENDLAREQLDINCALLWTSALKPTTRLSHGQKNGKVLTTEQVRAFYSKDGNRYNCYCAQTDCLVDDDGKLIASDTLKQGMARQRENWQKDNG